MQAFTVQATFDTSNAVLGMAALRQSIADVNAGLSQFRSNMTAAKAQSRSFRGPRGPGVGGGGVGAGGGGGPGGPGGGGDGGGIGLGSITGLVGLATVTALAKSVLQVADAWVDVTGRIKVAVGATGDATQVTDDLFRIAQKSRIEFKDIGNSFTRIATAGSGIGLTTTQSAKLVEVLSDAARVSHATAGEIMSINTQFPQFISKGKLAGDEMKSLLASAPVLVDAIAANFKKTSGAIGVTRGELLSMSKLGLVPVKETLEALFAAANGLAKRAAEAPRTMSQAVIQLGNDWNRVIGSIAEEKDLGNSINKSIDRLRMTITSEGFKSAITALMGKVVDVTNAIAKMAGDGTLQRFGERFIAIGEGIANTFLALFTSGGVIAGISGVSSELGKLHARLAELDRDQTIESKFANWGTGIRELRASGLGKSLAEAVIGDPGKVNVAAAAMDTATRNIIDRIKEMIAEGKLQIALSNARNDVERSAIVLAQQRLENERKITDEMRQKDPAGVARLQAVLNEKILAQESEKVFLVTKGVDEKIKSINAEREMEALQASGTRNQIIMAKSRVDAEKDITAEMIAQSKWDAVRLEAAHKQHAFDQIRNADITIMKDLYAAQLQVVADGLTTAATSGKSFSAVIAQMGVQLVKMGIQALLIKPAIDALAASMAKATGGNPLSSLLSGLGLGGGGGSSWADNTFVMPAMTSAGASLGSGASLAKSASKSSSSGGATIIMNIEGEPSERSLARMRKVSQEAIAAAAPHIVDKSVYVVQKKNRDSAGYLRR